VTSDVQALYQAVILDHNKRPRNFRALAGGRRAEGDNPLCGDHIVVYVRVDAGIITEATFQGFGCAIARASASLMTDSVKGKTVAEAADLFQRIHRLVTSPPGVPVEDLGPLSTLAGVRQFPVRVKCVTLPWRTLQAAAEARDEVVSTE
jgi:nitrogen fixation protein NifU and related proteins